MDDAVLRERTLRMQRDDWTKKIEDAERAKTLYMTLASTRGQKLAELEDKVAELEAANEELKKSGSPGDARRCAKLQAKNLQLSEEIREMRTEMARNEEGADVQCALHRAETAKFERSSALLKQQIQVLEPALKQATGERDQLARQFRAAATGGVDETQRREFKELKDAYHNQERINDSLEAKVPYLENKVDEFRTAFYDLREEYYSVTGGREPGTKLPDEVSRPPRACVPPVLTRTVQDAGADSGGEEHPNLDGRKRGRY